MDKDTAKKINGLRMVQNELSAYVDYREKAIMRALVDASAEDVKGLQRSFYEINRLRKLSEEVEQALKSGE